MKFPRGAAQKYSYLRSVAAKGMKSSTFLFCIRCRACGKAQRPRAPVTVPYGGGLTILLPAHRCRAASVRKVRHIMADAQRTAKRREP